MSAASQVVRIGVNDEHAPQYFVEVHRCLDALVAVALCVGAQVSKIAAMPLGVRCSSMHMALRIVVSTRALASVAQVARFMNVKAVQPRRETAHVALKNGAPFGRAAHHNCPTHTVVGRTKDTYSFVYSLKARPFQP